VMRTWMAACSVRKTPDPIMLPTTSAVAIQSPVVRFSLGESPTGAPPVVSSTASLPFSPS
jgi:hypothetical protein